MKKIISALFVSASLLCSASSYAATDINNTSAITFNANTSSLGATYGVGTPGKTFTENFTFSQGSLFELTSAIISISLGTTSGLDITGFTLTGNGVTSVGTMTSSAGLQTWTLTASNLSAGLYTLAAIGSVTGSTGGSFGGNINVAAVPEASTTAMMLGGLAVVGFAASRRRRKQGADTRATGLMPA